MELSLSAVILAAGNSERMGRSKALLPIGNGINFTRHLLNCFGVFGCAPVVLVVNEQFDSSLFQAENIVNVVNRQLEKGRSWSIHLGLKQVPEGFACFIQNIDNPYVEPVLLNKLLASVTPDAYSVPFYQKHGGHPILLGSEVVDFFRKQPDLPDFRQELQRFPRIEVPWPEDQILWNINTPDDYQRFMHRNRT